MREQSSRLVGCLVSLFPRSLMEIFSNHKGSVKAVSPMGPHERRLDGFFLIAYRLFCCGGITDSERPALRAAAAGGASERAPRPDNLIYIGPNCNKV